MSIPGGGGGDVPALDSLPPTELVVQAIRTLYGNTDPKDKERASAWLQNLQKSVFAWKVSDELLHAKIDTQCTYIAAQTLRTKIQHNFGELPADARASLRDSILEHFSRLDASDVNNSIVVTQISLALAYLALQMPEWRNAVPELVNKYAATHSVPLLELLTVLPQEVNNRHIRLGLNRREEVGNELRASSHLVAHFLETGLANADSSCDLTSRVYRCLTSWIQLGAVRLDGLLSSPGSVALKAFAHLESTEVDNGIHEAATDVVCSILERLDEEFEDFFGAMHSARNGNAAANNNLAELTGATNEQFHLALFNHIRRLESGYQFSVAQEDMTKSVNYCRVFTEFGECFLAAIVAKKPVVPPHFSVAIFDNVLACCGHPDYEIPDITFNLWYRVSEEVYQADDETLTNLFRPLIERLIMALGKHCQMEPDFEGVLEEGEDFPEFRARVTDLIKDVVFIVGSANIFKYMFAFLTSTSTSQWETMESALYVMSAVARNILPDENESVPSVMDAILGVNATAHVAVRSTSIHLIGELAEWVDRHPEYLERILNWLLAGLQEPQLASVAASALERICSQCRLHMLPHFEGLLQILRVLDTLNLKPDAANGLLKGVSAILEHMNPAAVEANLKVMVELQTVPLSKLLEANTPITKNTHSDPVIYLDRIAGIFRHAATAMRNAGNAVAGDGENKENEAAARLNPHPCQSVVVNDAWPVLSNACTRYIADTRVMERCCRTLRFAIRLLGVQSGPLLEPLAKQIVTLYQSHPHSCFLYLGSILVDEFSQSEQLIQGLLGMLDAFLPPTFKLLGEANGLTNHPDTVDDFFRLNTRFIQRACVPYLRNEALVKGVVECGLMACTLEHREANASVLKFFLDLFLFGRTEDERADFAERKQRIESLRVEVGPKLVEALLRAAIFNLPSYTFIDIGEVIYELMLLDRPSVCLWLEASLKALPTEGPGGVETVTRKQLVKFHKEVTSSEDPRTIVDSLGEFTRLWK